MAATFTPMIYGSSFSIPYKTKKLDDVSKYLMILIAIGAFLWLVYGIEKDDPYIIGVNVAAIALTMIVLSMKFRYEKYKAS